MSRYDLRHPLLTPERYRFSPTAASDQVRGLKISNERYQTPVVIHDTPDAIKYQVFGGLPTRCLHFSAGFHMYILHAQGYVMLGENVFATRLMRLHYLMDWGAIIPDTIYGDVAIFGTSTVNRDYSVPYEVVEQLIHLYDKL